MDRKNIFILSVFTLITALGWIAFDVYHAVTTTTISQSVEEQLTPISPTFEKGVINRVKSRSHVEPLEVGSLQSTPSQGELKEASGTSEVKPATRSGGP